jgi:hypothetical protein
LKLQIKNYDKKKNWGQISSQGASFQMFESKLQKVKFVQIKCSLYDWKALKA